MLERVARLAALWALPQRALKREDVSRYARKPLRF